MRLQRHKKARALNWNPGHAKPTLTLISTSTATATYANATAACQPVSQTA